MSSLLNETTGECISGTCQSIESVSGFVYYSPIVPILLISLIVLLGTGIFLIIKQIKQKGSDGK